MGRRLRDQSGFTLVEGAVAGLLVLIGLIGAIGVFESSGHESATGERQQLAAEQAQAELERLRDLPYDEIANAPTGWPASGQAGDPSGRVGGTPVSFERAEGVFEELAISASGGVAPYSEVEIPTGSSTLTLGVYRFVSWRDEDCPVLDLSGMIAPLDGLTTPATTLLGTILSPSGVLGTLLGPLFNLLQPAIRNRLEFARTLATGIQAELASLIDAIDDLDEIDPCDEDVAVLTELQETLEPMGPMLTELNSRINAYHAGCLKVLGVVVSCPGQTSSLYTNLNSTITNLQNADFESSIAELADAVGELGAADHPYNTKRVTVAVVLDPRDGTGPDNPVWSTSVITDPVEGLLAGAG